MNEQPGLPDQLRLKYPHLQPIKGPPSLLTINGFGVGVYGRRDFDAETQTYVKTRCFCAIFIPLIAVDAYRVADAGSGRWYFLGKEPLSSFARSWNIAMACVLLFIALGVAWDVHTSSPAYLAQQQITRAAGFMQAGEPVRAAGIYRQQLHGPLAADAQSGLKTALAACLKSDKAENNIAAFHLLAGTTEHDTLMPDAFNQGLALVEKYRAASPETALDILEAAAVLDPQNAALTALRVDLLKQVVAAKPDDINHLVELAVIYEGAGQLDASIELLRPHQAGLGATEGARILGRKLLAENNYADAYGLLFPYVSARLERLHAIETSYSGTLAAISRRAVADLNAGRAGPDFYNTYKLASKEQQEAMVDRYIEQQTKTDPSYQRALGDLKSANEIVPVALDLGIVQLNRAQGLKDAAARKTELEAAEKTFLAIRSFAGESVEYRLFLGQVYYWLGKSKEGRELFNQVLLSRKRDYSILMSISETLRAVGETKDARDMVDEAYRSAATDKEKFTAAALRSVLCKDEDERIAWLEKSDPSLGWIQIELNEARGQKALEKNDKPLAAGYLRKALTGYEAQPRTSAQLNNWALACFTLYEATGDAGNQQQGMALFEEAIKLDPGNSILLHNITYNLISLAAKNQNHDTIKLAALGVQPGLHLLSFLYHDEAGRVQIYQQLHDDEAMKKALGYLDKALLLAPKDISLYSEALNLQVGFRNQDEIQKLQQRFDIAAPDLTESRQEVLDSYNGTKDRENLEKVEQSIQMYRGFATNPAVAGDAPTLEYINVMLNGLQQNAWIQGAQVDGQELLRTALAAFQAHPSSASHTALKLAYFFRANEELAQQNPDYAALVSQTRRVIAPEYLVTLIMERNGPLAGVVRKNENVIHAQDLEKENVANYPGWASVSEWALLRDSAPDIAGVVAARFKDNPLIRLTDELELRISPLNSNSILDQYWTLKMLGDEKRATEIYQSAIHDGVPLPAL